MADLFERDTDDNEVDPQKDYLEELVGEGKKFADARELARAKAEADAHIRRIEAENAAFRDKLQQSKSIEDFMDQLRNQPIHRQEPPNHGDENEPGNAGTSISVEQLDELVTRKLTEKQKKDQAEANMAWVQSQLQSKYGHNFGDRVLQVGRDIGMTKDDMNRLAAEKPKAFMKLIGDATAPAPTSRTSVPESRVNTEMSGMPSGTRNYAYYQKLKRDNRKVYDSSRIQQEMHREALKQGAAFFD